MVRPRMSLFLQTAGVERQVWEGCTVGVGPMGHGLQF